MPPAPARIPRDTSGSPNSAVSAATAKSQARVSSRPPPSASPGTAAIHGRVRGIGDEAGEAALRAGDRRAPPGGDLLQVGAGAEHRPDAGEHADPEVLGGFDVVERRFHRRRDLPGHGVANLGAIQRDPRGMPVHGEVDGALADRVDPADGLVVLAHASPEVAAICRPELRQRQLVADPLERDDQRGADPQLVVGRQPTILVMMRTPSARSTMATLYGTSSAKPG